MILIFGLCSSQSYISLFYIYISCLSSTEAFYSQGKRGIVREAQKMAWPSLSNLDSRPAWDWSKFDQDGNGELDSVVIIHSGYGAETVTTDCFGADYNDRIWAHAFSSSAQETWTSRDGKYKLNGYTIASAFDWGKQYSNFETIVTTLDLGEEIKGRISFSKTQVTLSL